MRTLYIHDCVGTHLRYQNVDIVYGTTSMRLATQLNLLALEHGLRNAYLCVEEPDVSVIDGKLRSAGLSRSDRIVYDPSALSIKDVEAAHKNKAAMDKLLGLPSGLGGSPGTWWIDWEAMSRRSRLEGGFHKKRVHLFHFQSNVMDGRMQRSLIHMKNRWNGVFERFGFYVDFGVRYRTNKTWDDLK